MTPKVSPVHVTVTLPAARATARVMVIWGGAVMALVDRVVGVGTTSQTPAVTNPVGKLRVITPVVAGITLTVVNVRESVFPVPGTTPIVRALAAAVTQPTQGVLT